MYYELSLLPDSVKKDVCAIDEGKIDGVQVIRITLDRLLKECEKDAMRSCKRIKRIDGVCHYRYAPSIMHSYFYIEV